MKCLKCMKSIKKMNKRGIFKVNQYLIHIADWGICEDCLDITVEEAADYVHKYYISNKDRYAKLQKGYKEELTDSYVANVLADRTSLKGKDIPKEVIKAKRQYMKLNRIAPGKHPNSVKALQKHQWKKGKSGNPSGAPVRFSEEEQRKKELERHKKIAKLSRERLNDKYIKSLLCSNNSLRHKDIPKEMVEAKKLHIKTNRIIKENKDGR